MHFPLQALALVLLSVTGAFSDFLTPTYPPPTDLTSDKSLLSKAWKNITETLDGYLKQNQTSASGLLAEAGNVTFSLGMFSIYDPAAAKLQYHHTAPEVANAKQGVTKVDGDSVYKIASVTKLFTAFAGMIELSDEDWDRPVSQVVPGLAEYVAQTASDLDPVYTTQWDKITLWALASQLAGITQIGWPVSDALFVSALAAAAGSKESSDPVTKYGFPPQDLSVLGPCSNISSTAVCSPGDFIESIRTLPPVFQPWTSPAYSDEGFMLLGLAISNITGKTIDTIYREAIFEPLGMASSNSSIPTTDTQIARYVFAGDGSGGVLFDGGFTIPSGGLFSTINDLAKFSTGVLNSTLLPSEVTRRWMKPNAHTASLTYSVGAPWEIIRYVDPSSNGTIDIYTKTGDSGSYGGTAALIPKYGAGFNLLGASGNETLRSAIDFAILDLVTETVLPALRAQAAAEAIKNYVGTYASTDVNLNSSITISHNESTIKGADPALSISNWISNGTDVLASAFFDGVKPRLLTSYLKETSGEGRVAFQASTRLQTNSYAVGGVPGNGAFSGSYGVDGDWYYVDQQHYAGRGVNLFVFDVDGQGKATAVSPAAARVKLERKD
ncbi:uncharacterized protein KY384_000708 [Bacidia gigantensis]|uniref:uncharacterized protein n=1 Tax=Bacidia gigantensis TaxID=2732470 RepID=UPI001D037AFC|nr:uncharacterized protein KY384_000708 [Bacidia gigantensis]KAG8525946.1 hypothetical protein KY384_000708 [Bacidia gigantensis]